MTSLLAQQIAHILRDYLLLAFDLIINNVFLLRPLQVDLRLLISIIEELLIDDPFGKVYIVRAHLYVGVLAPKHSADLVIFQETSCCCLVPANCISIHLEKLHVAHHRP